MPISITNQEAELNRQAWQVLSRWEKPFLTVFGDSDPITRAWEVKFQEIIPGASHQNHMILHAGHFIQEDVGPELAEIIITFIRHYPEPEIKQQTI